MLPALEEYLPRTTLPYLTSQTILTVIWLQRQNKIVLWIAKNYILVRKEVPYVHVEIRR